MAVRFPFSHAYPLTFCTFFCFLLVFVGMSACTSVPVVTSSPLYPSFPTNFTAVANVTYRGSHVDRSSADYFFMGFQESGGVYNLTFDYNSGLNTKVASYISADYDSLSSLTFSITENASYLVSIQPDSGIYVACLDGQVLSFLQQYFFVGVHGEAIKLTRDGRSLFKFNGTCATFGTSIEPCVVYTDANVNNESIVRFEFDHHYFVDFLSFLPHSVSSTVAIENLCKAKFTFSVGFVCIILYASLAVFGAIRSVQAVKAVAKKMLWVGSAPVLFPIFILISFTLRAAWCGANMTLQPLSGDNALQIVNRLAIITEMFAFSIVICHWAAIPFEAYRAERARRLARSDGKSAAVAAADKLVLITSIVFVTVLAIPVLVQTALVIAQPFGTESYVYNVNIYVIAGESLILGTVFFVFGIRLFRVVHVSSSNSSMPEDKARQMKRRAGKILAITLLFFVCCVIRFVVWAFGPNILSSLPVLDDIAYPWFYYVVPDFVPALLCFILIKASPDKLKKEASDIKNTFLRKRESTVALVERRSSSGGSKLIAEAAKRAGESNSDAV